MGTRAPRITRSQAAATHAVAITQNKRKHEPDIEEIVPRRRTLVRDQEGPSEVPSRLTQSNSSSVRVASPTPPPPLPPQQQEGYPLSLLGMSYLTYMTRPSTHNPVPGPTTRQNRECRWTHGVLSGGMVIDILESLSATARPGDWSLALWLQRHYVEPFARIERLDGLVVESNTHVVIIQLAHERFVGLTGNGVKVQRLWVPGLEPTYTVNTTTTIVPDLPRRFDRSIWRASEMYYKYGFEVKRKGKCLGAWKDETNWERTLWTVQGKENDEEPKKDNLTPQLSGNIGPGNEGTAENHIGESTTKILDQTSPSPPEYASHLHSPTTEASSETLSLGEDEQYCQGKRSSTLASSPHLVNEEEENG